MTALSDIGTYLATQLSLVLGDTLFLNWKPEAPDIMYVLSDYLHDEPLQTMRTNVPLVEKPRLQLLVRHSPKKVPQCEAACRAGYVALCSISDMTLGTNRYTLEPIQTPTMIGRDEQQRVMYAVNFRVTQT